VTGGQGGCEKFIPAERVPLLVTEVVRVRANHVEALKEAVSFQPVVVSLDGDR
jgi:hypothetical protein